MKGRSLILIFLFFVVVVHPVYAETGSFHWMGSDVGTSPSFLQSGSFSYHAFTDNSLYFTDQQTLESFQSVTSNLSGSEFGYLGTGDVNSGHDNSVTIMSGTQVVGTGIFGYYKMADGRYNVYFYHWQDWNITGLTAPIRLTITDSDIGVNVGRTYAVLNPSPYSDGDCVIEFRNNVYKPVGLSGLFNTYSSYNYYNRYEYNSYINFNELNFIRDSFNKSKIIIEIDGSEVKNETSLTGTDLSWVDGFDVWNITMENIFGDNDSRQIVFETVLPDHSAVIEFNQSFYSSPEVVGVEYDIQNLDIVNYEYWILLTGTNDGIKYFVTNDYYDITTASGQDNFSISYSPLSLPFTMQAELWQYSKVSGESSVLAYSSEVAYNRESLAPGNIWTDKTEYNVSELVKIHYTSSAALVYIDVEQTDGDGHFYFDDLTTGIVRTFFFEHQVGTWRIRLRENGIYTNSTSVDVLPGPTPYVRWAYKNQLDLGYGAVIYVFADDSNATLAVFDGAGTETYNATVGDGYHTIQTKLYDYFAPGVWTASLLNSGTRYNDTTVVGSSAPIVRFDSTVYETGDTIGINYFIPSNEYKLILTDSNYKEIIKFTTSHGVIGSGSFETVPFSLVDGNEYGMNIQADIDNGKYKTGPWYVFVEYPNGTIDKTIYDSARVKRAISEPADASNEIIKIFFSPEGLFMIFTACLTMMGLVAAHHPAGGAAGAVVGVGFGVYFNVLPTWMLLLMVIALVVLAGVSVAVYFRGK